VTPGTLSGMNALIQKSTLRSSAMQHLTSLGPGHRPLMKVPEHLDGMLLRHVPGFPAVSVHDLPMQHLTFAASFGQRLLTVNPRFE
jgi:hypothetical protein